jgi:hypothetical protein
VSRAFSGREVAHELTAAEGLVKAQAEHGYAGEKLAESVRRAAERAIASEAVGGENWRRRVHALDLRRRTATARKRGRARGWQQPILRSNRRMPSHARAALPARA